MADKIKVTGHRLKESIKFHQLHLNAAKEQFTPSLHAFADEVKSAPESIDDKIFGAERAIARLQTAQSWYNLQVFCCIQESHETITLSEAIKVIGGAGRREARWRSASTPEVDRYRSHMAPTRDANQTVAQRTVSYEYALEKSVLCAKFASQLRVAIAQANMQELEVPDGFLQEGDLV